MEHPHYKIRTCVCILIQHLKVADLIHGLMFIGVCKHTSKKKGKSQHIVGNYSSLALVGKYWSWTHKNIEFNEVLTYNFIIYLTQICRRYRIRDRIDMPDIDTRI